MRIVPVAMTDATKIRRRGRDGERRHMPSGRFIHIKRLELAVIRQEDIDVLAGNLGILTTCCAFQQRS